MKTIKIVSLFILLALIGCQKDTEELRELSTDIITQEEQAALTPDQVIQRLKEGNKRFVNGNLTPTDYNAQVKATASGQYPKAVVLSCLDSRVPVELIFDRGVGDIFVGRVAGNIESDHMLGSFEYGTNVAGSKLILVLGHTSCGAVKGAVDYAAIKDMGMKNLNVLLRDINPAVEGAIEEGEERSSSNKELVNRAVENNVILTIERIREKSETLRKLEVEGSIKIVGAVYDLKTGKVNWL